VLRKRPAGWLLCKASQFSKRPPSNESASPLSPDLGVAGVAYAKIFMASAATALNRLGLVMVPRVQLTETVKAPDRHPADRSPQPRAASRESATTPGLASRSATRGESRPVARGPGGTSIMVGE
jgi:hypothetical protein